MYPEDEESEDVICIFPDALSMKPGTQGSVNPGGGCGEAPEAPPQLSHSSGSHGPHFSEF